jgi:hypothetical protein
MNIEGYLLIVGIAGFDRLRLYVAAISEPEASESLILDVSV